LLGKYTGEITLEGHLSSPTGYRRLVWIPGNQSYCVLLAVYLIEAQKKTIHPQRRWINVTAQ